MNKVLQVVEKLNSIILDRFGDQDQSLFTYITSGYVEAIELDGHVIWCSETDGWEFEDGENDIQIPLFNTVTKLYHRWYYNLPLPHTFIEYTTN